MTTRLLPLICLLLFMIDVASAQEQATAPKNEVLERFVGVWDLKTTIKPAKWNPDGGETTGQESTVWALKNRVIIIRDVSAPDGRKGMFIATHDAQQDAYPFWGFDSNGLLGGQWLLKWNAEASATVGRPTDTPPAWTGGAQNRFTDANTNLVSYWMRDENGALLIEGSGRKDRLPADREAAIVAAWKKHEPPADLPAELKMLDRMIGTWEVVSVRKPAIWSPSGDRVTGTITREWILNGRCVMGTSVNSDGSEALALYSFDPGKKEFRNWFFSSAFLGYASQGPWTAAKQTFSLTASRDDGKITKTSLRFDGPDREVWHTLVTDAAGKIYVDMDSTLTRHTTARDKDAKPGDKQPKPSDQSRLQGTWGAVAYPQDGKGGDEPIAPEDAAIKYIFQRIKE